MGTITRINNKKGASFRAQIRKFHEGKLIYSETKTFPKRPLAQRWLFLRESELDSPEAAIKAKNSTTLVSDLIERYIKDFGQNAGRTKRFDLQKLLTYEISSLPAHKLTTDKLISHVSYRLQSAKPQTVQNDLVWLRNVYKVAEPAWGMPLDASHIDSALSFCRKKGMVARPDRRARRPSNGELLRLSRRFKSSQSTIPMFDLLWFAIYSARRLGEITNLRWEDNDSKTQTGMVRDIKHPRKKGLNKRFKYTDIGWRIVQRQPRVSEYIFPYNEKSISTAFTRACKVLSIEDLRFHDLRHEATSRLFERGYSITEVQMFTLHQSWDVMKIYTNLRPEDVALR